jgi:hypothetical protein
VADIKAFFHPLSLSLYALGRNPLTLGQLFRYEELSFPVQRSFAKGLP